MNDTVRHRERLVELREELQQRLARIRDHGAAGVPSDSQEQATARENDDVLQSLKLHVENELVLITGALARIEQGTYGACTRCAEPIEPGRLELIPFTPVCSGCA